jgi:histone deacetylase 1/2
VVQQVLRKNKIAYTPKITPYVCDSCQLAKSHQLPYPISSSRSTVPLEQVFSDVWGPAPLSVGKHAYYVSFIDDFSKFTWIYVLKKCSDVYQAFLNFQQYVERKFDRKIITIQSDWGGEYEKLHSFFQKAGISHHVSCPHAHQQNGSAERKHHHIVEVGLALLANASMPLKYWDEAFLTATFLINLLPSKVIDLESPAEHLLHVKPNYDALRVFGCACWPNLRPYNTRKLAFRSKRCVFLGYSPLHKGVKCLDISTGRIYISRDVVFDENVFPFHALHPNAGALLKKEILLLPSNNSVEDAHDIDEHMTSIVPIVAPNASLQEPTQIIDNIVQNDPQFSPKNTPEADESGADSEQDFVEHSSDYTDPEADSPASSLVSSPGGRTPLLSPMRVGSPSSFPSTTRGSPGPTAPDSASGASAPDSASGASDPASGSSAVPSSAGAGVSPPPPSPPGPRT